jgi:Flp pilus assembly protein TadB
MAIPWLIGIAAAAVAAAVLSDSEEEKQERERENRRERERERSREESRLSRVAEQQRMQAQAEEQQRSENRRKAEVESFSRQRADSIIQKYALVGVSAQNIAPLVMTNPKAAKETLQRAYTLSQPYKDLQKTVFDKEADLNQIEALLKTLEVITK